MIDRCIGKDAMAEVEDMARPTPCLIKNPLHFLLDQIRFTEEDNGIEISLNGNIITNAGPSLTDIHPPIHADNIPSCPLHEIQKC